MAKSTPMLRNVSRNDVIALKLSYGEEVVGRFVEFSDDNEHIILEKVRTVAPQMLSQQEVGIQLIPWVFSDTDPTVAISKDHIVTAFAINNDTSKRYLEHTTSILL